MKTQIMSIAFAGALSATAADANTMATAVTDLNLRAGPGPGQPILTVIPDDGEVAVRGCLVNSSWCEVSYNGTGGWAYGEYLTAPVQGEPKILVENRDLVEIGTVTYQEGNVPLVGETAGAVVGAVVSGPAGTVITPDERAIIYVRENEVEPIYLDGEVVVGATLPEVVELRPVPEYDYTYAYVNGVPVLVEPAERRVIHILR